MLRGQLQEDMKAAMKAGEKEKLEVLRYLMAEIKNEEIEVKHELEDEKVIGLLRKEVKRRKEAVVQFEEAGRDELATSERSQLELIEAYLPAMMSREDIEKVVDEVIAGGAGDFGAVMGQVMSKVKGKADGGDVSEVVKEKLAG